MASPRIVPTGILGGIAGKDGSNVLPTDTAIKNAIQDSTSQTAVALSASIAAKVPVTAFPPASGSDDTTALNSVLSAANPGQTVKGVPGSSYKISAPLVVGSGITLDMTGCTITLLPGSQCNMVRNAAVAVLRTVAGTMTASSKTFTKSSGASFTSADVGRWIVVTGAYKTGPWTPTTGPLVAQIKTITSATVVQLDRAAQNAVTAASAAVHECDRNIAIVGGTWDRGANGWDPVGGAIAISPDLCTTQLFFIDGLRCLQMNLKSSGTSSTGGGFNLYAGAIRNFTIADIHLDSPVGTFNTDGINIQGPAALGSISRVFGTCGDDLVALLAINPVAPVEQTVGDITDVEITELFPDASTSRALVILGGGGTTLRGIHAKGIHGSCASGTGNAVVQIGDYSYSSPSGATQATYDGVIIEGVDTLTSSGSGLINISVTANAKSKITLRDVTWRTTGASLAAIYVTSDSVLGMLDIDGLVMKGSGVGIQIDGTVDEVRLHAEAPDPSITYDGVLLVNGTVRTLNLHDCYIKRTAGDQSKLVSAVGTVDQIIASGTILRGGGAFLYTGPSAATLVAQLDDTVVDGAQFFAQLSSPVTFLVTNMHIRAGTGVAGGVMLALVASGASVFVRGRGIYNPSNYGWFYRSASQAIRVDCVELGVDVSILSPQIGDQAFNTNSGLACGLAPVMSDSTHWKNLYSGAATP